MPDKESIKLSKFLSLVLRHHPEVIDLEINEQGWASVAELLEKLKIKGMQVDEKTLKEVVAANNKKRFAFNENQTMIRASQGHSMNVNLGYEEQVPPAILYHGTAEKNVASVLKEGLVRQERQHVHLSIEKETAENMGKRHGKPVVLAVAAIDMYNDGFAFYLSANNVWLTEAVPVVYLKLLNEK